LEFKPMSILTFPTSPTRRSLRAAALQLLSDAVQQWRYRQADHALQGMSDAMLHDIGISRSEIMDATRHGRSGRP
jgi:uncharacterized protein YjiS (DUF1127 family)